MKHLNLPPRTTEHRSRREGETDLEPNLRQTKLTPLAASSTEILKQKEPLWRGFCSITGYSGSSSFQGAVRSERTLGHCRAPVLVIARKVDEPADGTLALLLLARRDRHLVRVRVWVRVRVRLRVNARVNARVSRGLGLGLGSGAGTGL